MVNINTVYKTVQSIMNIEQRGFLAPSEFNRYAQQAQLEIFESYPYDMAHFNVSRKGNDKSISKILIEKMDVFIINTSLTLGSDSRYPLPTDLYRLKDVYYTGGTDTVIIEKLDHERSQYVLNSRLTAPSAIFPKYKRYNSSAQGIGEIQVFPNTIITNVTIDYIKQPAVPIWGYTRLGTSNVPLYDQSSSTHFDLHPSEQYVLVQMVLKYAGVQIDQLDIVQVAATAEQLDEQTKKS